MRKIRKSKTPLKRRSVKRSNSKFGLEKLEDRIVLTAPQFVSIQPNGGELLTSFEVLSVAPREITIRFDQDIDGSETSLDGIKLLRDGQEISDIVSREVGILGNTVILRFAESLPDDVYSIQITDELKNLAGEQFDPTAPVNSAIPMTFELELGTKISAVVPQPITRGANGLTQALNQIELYFDSSELDRGLAQTREYYQLIFTNNTATNADDAIFLPVSDPVYDDAEDKVTLTFADDLHELAGEGGSFRLRVGTNDQVAANGPDVIRNADLTEEPKDFFAAAYPLGIDAPGALMDGNSLIVESQIENTSPFPLAFPGATSEPGQHVFFDGTDLSDPDSGIEFLSYEFPATYGAGFENLITEQQKQRVREVLEIWSHQTGVDVAEVVGGMLAIAAGGMAGGPATLVFDASLNWNDEFLAADAQGQPSFSAEAFRSFFGSEFDATTLDEDLSTGDIRFLETTVEPIFPRTDVLLGAQHAHRPESTDVDLYKFEITGEQAGAFRAEVLAERAASSSTLDSVLRLYRESGVGASVQRELIAQNDDYFSEDSFLELELSPGTYYLGISSTGNDSYDPSISGTGIGGTSEGNYELRLDFRADNADSLADSSGAIFDGDNDGTPGGVYNFWFRAATPSGTEISENEVQSFDLGNATGGNFRVRFDGQLSGLIPFDATAADVQAALDDLPNIQQGDISVTGLALPSGPVSIEFTGNLALANVAEIQVIGPSLAGGAITISTITNGQSEGRTVYVDKADTTPDNLANAGTLANPYNVIHAAFNLDLNGLPKTGSSFDTNGSRAGDIVRIVGNGNSLESSIPYAVGLRSDNNQPLPDGAKFDIPNDVAVMVDAGAVFKMKRSAVVVGSTAIGDALDHRLATFQVLGTPTRTTVFTSTNDTTIGIASPSIPTDGAPSRGDWGGILFAGNLDQASNRERYEERGIFINHVGQTEITYGGGLVNIGSVNQNVTPIDIRDARPRISYSNIHNNQIAAISATPDSFEETNFHTPEFQGTAPFTSDYTRIGPDIQGNQISDNTINGLFIRIDTLSGTALTKQTVSGRWNDNDIVHVLTEVLEIQGTPGGPLDVGGGLQARTDARLSIDPNVVVKLDSARIEVGIGSQFIAEGLEGQEVIFTSINDDRFGGSGSFDASNNDRAQVESAGDWGGVYVGHSSSASIDHALIAFGGGLSAIEGDFVGFNAVEIHQGQARIANVTFVSNSSGLFGTIGNREGRGINDSATVFIRGAQPIIVGNEFISGSSHSGNPAAVRSDLVPAININANSLNRIYTVDSGRSTGMVDLVPGNLGNQGPLVRGNRLLGNDINGMLVRGETLSTESVWDDTDIVHVLFDPIYVPNLKSYGGLRLESSAAESLVVKMGGNAAFHATGTAGFTNDRIGGSVHIIGQPERPVVLTSIADTTAGAGSDLDGAYLNETIRMGLGTPDDRGTLDIQFNFSREVAENPLLVASLEEAARFWESQLTDDIQITFDVFQANLGQSVLANASSDGSPGFAFDQVIAAMQADAANDEADLLNRLPNSSQIRIQAPVGSTTLDNSTISLGLPNAKALGLPVVSNPSLVVSGEPRDGQININELIARSSTIEEFVPTMIHEIGHAIGFSSNVPTDGQLEPGFVLSTWDLFRLAPGAGVSDFTNSPRVIDPNLQQVVYDGGLFDPTGIDISGLTLGDIPVSRGEEFEDGTPHPDDGQTSHWRSRDALGMNGISIGIMEPTAGGSFVTQHELRSLGLMGWDLDSFALPDEAAPGAWEGITLDRYSNDRNVETITESESSGTDATGSNGIPDRAEFIGELAASEFEGDENLRLGFEIHGVINEPNDIDIFSFQGIAGTEVWIDVDNTSPGLDAVVDLIDAQTSLFARSDNAIDGASDLTGSAQVTPEVLVDTSGFYPTDHFTVNPSDPGMKLTLPGTPGTRGTYYVRMLSSGSSTEFGTEGAYELNLRLREVDEAPGSTVRHADIRYATNGISVDGLLANSPIQAEFVEPGDTISHDLALNIGSPYESNRGELSVSGSLEQVSTVEVDINGGAYQRDVVQDGIDWYQFSSDGDFTIDLDFAAGVGSDSDTQIAVYQVGTTDGNVDEDNADGMDGEDEDDEIIYSLVYFGDSSSVADDQGGLSFQSSFDTSDPFIGPATGGTNLGPITQLQQILPNGLNTDNDPRDITYSNDFLIAVTSPAVVPIEVYDRYNSAFYPRPVTTSPIANVVRQPVDLNTDVTFEDFTLEDLTLYVATSEELHSVNPLTGEPLQGQDSAGNPIGRNLVGFQVDSLAIRPDGTLFSLSRGITQETSGNFLSIDWARIVDDSFNEIPEDIVENLGDDGVMGFVEVPPTMPGDPSTYEDFGDHINYFGLHISDDVAYAVGERSGKNDPALLGPLYVENMVYMIDAYPTEVDGNETEPGTAVPDDTIREDDPNSFFYFDSIPGALTDIIEVGAFDTTADGGPGGIVQGLVESGGVFYGVTDLGGLHSLTQGPIGTGGQTQFLGPVGGSFRGLELGPDDVDGGNFASTLFGITDGGVLHAFDFNGNAVNAFNGSSTLSTGLTDTQGLAFSTLDTNLWHVDSPSGSPGTPVGNPPVFNAPGQVVAFNAQPNGFFTGNESEPGVGGYNPDYNFPGGAHGAFEFDVDLTTAIGEFPNLYFDYQLRSELPEQAAFNDSNRAIDIPNDADTDTPVDDFFEDTNRDVLRIYATDVMSPNDNDWVLMASNNPVDAINPDTTGIILTNYLVSPTFQELFDNSRLYGDEVDNDLEFFRQARIPLTIFGGSQITVRVEFASEGTFYPSSETDWVNGAVDFRPGHQNGNYEHVPVRKDDTTDNQVPTEVDSDLAFLGAEIGNIIVGNSSRGEEVRHGVFSEPDGTAEPPRFIFDPRFPLATGNYQLYIRPGSSDIVAPFEAFERFSRYEPTTFNTNGIGDTNRFRDQGQLILHSNRITDSAEYGIRVETAEGVTSGAANLIATNSERLVRGPVIENNVIAGSGFAGIRFAGDDLGVGAVQFGRIVNNTVVGSPINVGVNAGIGIEIGDNTSPTLLNNLIAYTDVAVTLATSSASTKLAGNLYHANANDGPINLDSSPILTTATDIMFVNASDRNFLLADQSLAIDTAIDSEEDRPTIVSVTGAIGIDFESSVLAPELDSLGQFREDDPTFDPPMIQGLGSNIGKDRGALERVDRVGPRAALLTPFDNDLNDIDGEINDVVTTRSGPFNFFEIRLFDVDLSGNDLFGVGIDDSTVLLAPIVVRRDQQLLELGQDYELSYDSTNDVIRVIPLPGIWTNGSYEITIDGSIADLAGNPLSTTGSAKTFTINLIDELGPEGDYGDAPVPYPTRFSNGGAYHLQNFGGVSNMIFLGSSVSIDTDGSPSDRANGDADDDGVAFGGNLTSGVTQTIEATASAASFLDAWIDFDGDGVWSAGEQIFTSESLVAGVNVLSIDIPSDAIEQTIARFRVSSDSNGLTPGGGANDGEVEDYSVSIVAAGLDFGDAPAPYPVASHRVLPGFHLGDTVDTESDTLATDAGDDGVVFASTLLTPGSTTSVTVTPSAPGVLEAWIDFNGDGDWDDAGEQLFNGPSPLNGVRTLTIDVPSGATLGNTQARFRFSDGLVTLSPAGAADNGEVEDYSVVIADSTSDWHNEVLPEDVNASGVISPLDALLVINELNDRLVSDPVTGVLNLPANPPPFIDVNNDGVISPTDAITVINAINPTNPTALTVPAGDNSAGDTGPLNAPLSSSVVTSDGVQNSDQHNDLALRSYQPTDAASNEPYVRRDTNETEENDLLDDFFASL